MTGVGEWHINADEPAQLDYNTDFKTPHLIANLYAPDQYRMSDHDPVLVGLNLNAAPTAGAGGPYSVAEGGSVTVSATGSDPDGGVAHLRLGSRQQRLLRDARPERHLLGGSARRADEPHDPRAA